MIHKRLNSYFLFSMTLLCLFFISTQAMAQDMEITYNETANIEAQLAEVEDPQMKQELRPLLEYINRNNSLFYHKGESFYEKSKLADEESSLMDMHNEDRAFIMDDDNVVYKNHKDQKSIAQKSIFDKKFIIEGSFNQYEWNLLPDTVTILGKTCRKAVSKQGVIAWYCSDIPISDGPDAYAGLPGLIMRVETPYIILNATAIKLEKNVENKIQIPQKGKKVSDEEFEQLMEDKTKEMQDYYKSFEPS